MSFPIARTGANDWREPVIGATCIVFSVAAAIAGWTGLLPATTGTSLVIVGSAVMLRVAWVYVAKSPSRGTTARATLLSNVSLAISALTLIAVLPRITSVGGVMLLLTDVGAQLWTMAILMLLAGMVRTFGWRVFTGTFVCGFLALTGLARFVGRPLVERFGTSDLVAVGVWVPMTEEAIKMIPVAIVLFTVLRRTERRPSALDVMLVGAWAGAGFATYESATFGRGTFSLMNEPITSWFYPMAVRPEVLGWPIIQVGHLIHSALLALALGFYFFYRHRFRWAWIALVVAIVSVLLEHCSQNAISIGAVTGILARVAIVLDAGGRLAPYELLVGVVFVAFLESRALGRPALSAFLRLTPSETTRRSLLLAKSQTGFAR